MTRSDSGAVLASYLDGRGRRRQVLTRTGLEGSLLVVDRDCTTRGDDRLVAHLAPDEPASNAEVICGHYLHDPPRRRCRRLSARDITVVPFAAEVHEFDAAGARGSAELRDAHGWTYRLGPRPGDSSRPQLRWYRARAAGPARDSATVSVREVVGALESYGPVRGLTLAALARHRGEREISLTRLRAELERVNCSPIVLNRALREAVLGALRTQGLSLSEIAIRCGRVKRDARGNVSGETSWLARRVGLAPEGTRRTITPWIHTDVLALIARRGLGLSPREVEVD